MWSLVRAPVRTSGPCTTSDKHTKCGRTRKRSGSHATARRPSEAYEGIVDQVGGVKQALIHHVPSA